MRTDNTQADTYIRVHFMLKTVSPGDVTEDWRYDLTLASQRYATSGIGRPVGTDKTCVSHPDTSARSITKNV